jgi:hypothetical protein
VDILGVLVYSVDYDPDAGVSRRGGRPGEGTEDSGDGVGEDAGAMDGSWDSGILELVGFISPFLAQG